MDPLGAMEDPLGALDAPEPAAPEPAPVAAEEKAAPVEEAPKEPEPAPTPAPAPVRDEGPQFKIVTEWIDGKEVDPEILVKQRVNVQGEGEGTVLEFHKSKMFGASAHTVNFDKGGAKKVMLERHGNKKTPFTVRTEKKVEVKVKKAAKKTTRSSSGGGFQTFGSGAACLGDGDVSEQFREAIKAGDMGTVRRILDNQSTELKVSLLQKTDKLGNCSLHQAAIFNQSEMLQLFLETGGKQLMEIVNRMGETPIKVAKPYMQQRMRAFNDTGVF